MKSLCMLFLCGIMFLSLSAFNGTSTVKTNELASRKTDAIYVGYFDYSLLGGLSIQVKVYVDPVNQSEITYGGDGINSKFTATGTYIPGTGGALGTVQNFSGNDGQWQISYSGPLDGM